MACCSDESSKLEKGVTILEDILDEFCVQMVMRQRDDDPQDVLLLASLSSSIEDKTTRLADKGFGIGSSPTHTLIMRDSQEIKLKFRGNIKEESDLDEIKMRFYPFIESKLSFRVAVTDIFAQREHEYYRGFVQIYADDPNVMVEKESSLNICARNHICDLLLNLPKVSLIYHFTRFVTTFHKIL